MIDVEGGEDARRRGRVLADIARDTFADAGDEAARELACIDAWIASLDEGDYAAPAAC